MQTSSQQKINAMVSNMGKNNNSSKEFPTVAQPPGTASTSGIPSLQQSVNFDVLFQAAKPSRRISQPSVGELKNSFLSNSQQQLQQVTSSTRNSNNQMIKIPGTRGSQILQAYGGGKTLVVPFRPRNIASPEIAVNQHAITTEQSPNPKRGSNQKISTQTDMSQRVVRKIGSDPLHQQQYMRQNHNSSGHNLAIKQPSAQSIQQGYNECTINENSDQKTPLENKSTSRRNGSLHHSSEKNQKLYLSKNRIAVKKGATQYSSSFLQEPVHKSMSNTLTQKFQLHQGAVTMSQTSFVLQQDQKSYDKLSMGSADRDYSKEQTLKAAVHAQNKNPYTKAQFKKIEVENDKMLRSMCMIQKGKDLKVASHRMKTGDMELKSLNFVRNKQIAEATDKENEHVLHKIQKATSNVPSTQNLQHEWTQKQSYKKNLQQKNYTQRDIRQLLNRRQFKLGTAPSQALYCSSNSPNKSCSSTSRLPKISVNNTRLKETSQYTPKEDSEKADREVSNNMIEFNEEGYQSRTTRINAQETTSKPPGSCRNDILVKSSQSINLKTRRDQQEYSVKPDQQPQNFGSSTAIRKEKNVLNARLQQIENRVYGLRNRQNEDLVTIQPDLADDHGSTTLSPGKTERIDSVPDLYVTKQKVKRHKMKSKTDKIAIDDMDNQDLDVELNRKGFRGMQNRPMLRNMHDSRQHRMAKILQSKQSYEKFAKTASKRDDINLVQNVEVLNDSFDKPRPSLFSPSDRSNHRSFASNMIDNVMLKAWTTHQTSSVDSEILSRNSEDELQLKKDSSTLNRQKTDAATLKKSSQIGSAYQGPKNKPRNQIIGIQEMNGLSRMKKRLNNIDISKQRIIKQNKLFSLIQQQTANIKPLATNKNSQEFNMPKFAKNEEAVAALDSSSGEGNFKENSRYMNLEGIVGQTDERLSETSGLFIKQVAILDNEHAVARSNDSDDIDDDKNAITPHRNNKHGSGNIHEKTQISEADICLEESPDNKASMKVQPVNKIEKQSTEEYPDDEFNESENTV